MMNVSDATLLNQFTRGENPAAFDELAARHADWVYSAALRLVHDAHLAEDITQAVFLLLAQNAARLGNRPVNAWLFKVTRYCAANALRIDRRRRQHERTAAMLKSDSMDAEVQPIWEQMVPLLEESISHLKSEDRQALLLRFYQRKSLADVGAAMGISEDAAQKRVAKAVEKLRSLMSGKGVLIPAVVAASALLFEQTAHAAPAGLVARCIPGAASAGAVQIAQGVNKMLLLSKLKLAIVAALLITAVPLGFWTALHAAGANQITTPNQTAGPAPTAPPFGPAGEQSMSVAAADAAIAPFCNSHTQMIISFNLSDIDPDALAGWLQTNLLAFNDPADAADRDLIINDVAGRYGPLKRMIDSLTKAGCQSEYLLAMQRGKYPDDIVGMFAFPIGLQTNVQLLDNLFGNNNMPSVNSPDGHGRLYAAKPDSEMVMNIADEHSVLLDALTAAGYGTVRIAFNPSVLKYSGPIPGIMGLGDLSEPQWKYVNWGSITLFLLLNSSATVILQCQNDSSAAALVRLIDDKFASLQNPLTIQKIAADAARQESQVPVIQKIMTQLAPLLAQIKPVVAGNRVIVTFDKPTTEMLLAIWYQSSFYEEPRHRQTDNSSGVREPIPVRD